MIALIRAAARLVAVMIAITTCLHVAPAAAANIAYMSAAGTGNTNFTTDTTAALRASEMGCEALLKATKVDGVYDADPEREPRARRFERLDYLEVLSRDLRVMDASAISLARENHIPILVFSIFENGGFADVLRGRGRLPINNGQN